MKKVIGQSVCHCCAGAVHVVENEKGTLSYSCVPCDWSPYFKPGTDGHRLQLGRTKLKAAPVPLETAPAPPKAAPAPVPPVPPKKAALDGIPSAAIIKKNTVFG